jgi:hypothetical protein
MYIISPMEDHMSNLILPGNSNMGFPSIGDMVLPRIGHMEGSMV